MNKILTKTFLAVALLYAIPVLAQTAPAGSGSTGNFPVITVPPPPMTSVANQPTPGADSTLWSNGIPGPQSSSVTIPLPAAGGGTGGGGGGGGGGFVCTPGQTQTCASNACPPNYTGTVPTSMTCVSPGTWPTTCTPTVAMIDANPTAYGCTPIGGTCTPGTTTVNQTANCPSGYETASGSTTFTQTATVTTTCPGPVTSQGPWTPSASSICTVPVTSGLPQTCSVQCPVQCAVTGIVSGYRTWSQEWAGGGGSGCPAGGTRTGASCLGTSATCPTSLLQCTGTMNYSFTSTTGCPTTSSGSTGCTLAQVNAGTCATCSRTCGSTESGFATCQTHGITATTCSYWSYSGSSCPAGATGGSWRAGLCP